MCDSDEILPATFRYHIIDGHAPDIYIVFWCVGAVCCLVTLGVIIPHAKKIRDRGKEVREEDEEILMPMAYSAVLLIVFFPVVLTWTSFFTFIAPISRFASEFIANCYEGLCLYFFARLLVMYLGSFKKIMTAFRNAQPSNYWASPPFACCFRKCIKERIMNERDFRIIYFFIIQYAIIPSFLSFMQLFNSYSNRTGLLSFAAAYLDPFTALLCIYGLICLMRASGSILKHHDIRGKFLTIQFCVLGAILPSVFVSAIGVNTKDSMHSVNNNGDSDYYSSEVLEDAYGKFVEIILITLISFRYPKYFTIKDCDTAYEYNQNAWFRRLTQRRMTQKVVAANSADDGSTDTGSNANDLVTKNENNDNDNV